MIVLASRQSGKTNLIRSAAAARAEHAEMFGETQEVLHVSRRVTNASKTIRHSFRWAESNGYHHGGSGGRESITWPDGSYWQVSSDESVWGETASLAFLDEAWDLAPMVLDQAVMPTLVERSQPQVWLLSAANPKATSLVQEQRVKASRQDNVLLLEWSPAPDDDLMDPEVWRACSPHWSAQRQAMMDDAKATVGFAEQWLNRWPPLKSDGLEAEWPRGWSECRRLADGPPRGLLGALETSLDRARYGVAVARQVGGQIEVWAATFGTLELAQSQLQFWGCSTVIQGASIESLGPWQTERAGMKETRQATPTLADLVRRGLIAHNHDHDVALETATAEVSRSEAGQALSAHRSTGTVCGLKAAMWAVWAVQSGTYAAVRPAIW